MSSNPKWLGNVWDEQTEEAFFYFCAWGYMWKGHQKGPKLSQILKCPLEWEEVIKLWQGQPYSFQGTYGSRETVLRYFQFIPALFSTGFPALYRELRDEVSRNRVLFISSWICLLFMTYLCFTPRKLQRRVVQKCFLLSCNAQYIYRDFWEYIAAWSNEKRTLKINLPKKREHTQLSKRVLELLDERGSSTIFAELKRNSQADFLRKELEKEGIKRHTRTIYRILEEMDSSSNLTLREALTYVRVSRN